MFAAWPETLSVFIISSTNHSSDRLFYRHDFPLIELVQIMSSCDWKSFTWHKIRSHDRNCFQLPSIKIKWEFTMQHQHCSISCQMASNQQLNTNYSNKENNKMEILKIFQLEKITGMDSLETRSKSIFQFWVISRVRMRFFQWKFFAISRVCTEFR